MREKISSMGHAFASHISRPILSIRGTCAFDLSKRDSGGCYMPGMISGVGGLHRDANANCQTKQCGQTPYTELYKHQLLLPSNEGLLAGEE